jgi:hypothetical protein
MITKPVTSPPCAPAMSAADVAAHAAASHGRLPRRVPGVALREAQTDAAYAQRAAQLRAAVTAERAVSGAL